MFFPKKRFFFASFCAVAALVADVKSYELDKFIDDGGALLATTQDDLITGERQPLMRWTSTARDSARYPGYGNSPAATFLGMRVYEAIFNYTGDKFARLDVSLFNRGDAGDIPQDKFDALVEEIEGKLAAWSGADRPAAENRTRMAGNNLHFKAWNREPLLAVLVNSNSGRGRSFRAEYIKVALYPHQDARTLLADLSRPPRDAGPRNLVDNIVSDDNGDVFIDNVPMVDQGDKGYCAVAVSERVLRYYQIPFDQHLLAQLADTGEQGTNVEVMLAQFKRAGTRMRIRVRELYNNSMLNSIGGMRSFLSKYNRVAKREKQRELDMKNFTINRVVNLPGIFDAMDTDLLRRVRVEQEKRDFDRFKRDIRSHVDQGIPLVWCLILGKITESDVPQAGGGHARLIIGYNDEKDTVIYSDSWGANHEKKEMPAEDAWAVTSNLSVFLPR